jgi:hypothetical protein
MSNYSIYRRKEGKRRVAVNLWYSTLQSSLKQIDKLIMLWQLATYFICLILMNKFMQWNKANFKLR